jgi:hypothetical protein
MFHECCSYATPPTLGLHNQHRNEAIIVESVLQNSVSQDLPIGDNEAISCKDRAQNELSATLVSLRYHVKRANLFNVTFCG